ncbi:MAG TPA: phosphotransferase [Anaerolineaceae bacterium]
MIPVPEDIQKQLARAYGADQLVHFGGGHEGSDGIVYAYPFDGDGWARRRLLKVMAIPAAEQERGLFCLEERLRFMRAVGEQGAPVVYPQLSPQMRLYETASTADHLFVGYSMEIAPGKTPNSNCWDPAFFRRWGRLIGSLHRLSRLLPRWEASIFPATGEQVLTWKEEWQGFGNWCKDEEVGERWREIGKMLETLPIERASFGFIHNDPHIWNLLDDGQQITLLDFDVANHHWFVTDISIACQSVLFDISGGMQRPLEYPDKLKSFLGYFREGYEQEHSLAEEWWQRLDLFIAYRRILLFIAMYDWICSKPDLFASWKRMILAQPVLLGEM